MPQWAQSKEVRQNSNASHPNLPEPIQTYLNQFKLIETNLNLSESIWTFPKLSRKEILINVHIKVLSLMHQQLEEGEQETLRMYFDKFLHWNTRSYLNPIQTNPNLSELLQTNRDGNFVELINVQIQL